MKALFVTTQNSLGNRENLWGGVQICTNEYLAVLRQAGFEISPVAFDVDRRLGNRLIKRFWPRPYRNILPPGLKERIFTEIKETRAEWIFLNLIDLAPLARPIRKQFGSAVKIVLLSHGLGCADILHEYRIRSMDNKFVSASAGELLWMGEHLIAECDQRKYLDHVFCLSEFDVGLENWVGARSVSWLPRVVSANPLPWHPVPNRVGFVGSLEHAPNAEGLELFLRAAKKGNMRDLTVRVIGGPKSIGMDLKRRFGHQVDYLGSLNNDQLKMEAATWSCALHPLFCYSRGCSTKLATLLGWQIPVVTTPQGCRGYTWRNGSIPQGTTPESVVDLALRAMDPAVASEIRSDVVKVVQSSPTSSDVAALIREHLEGLQVAAFRNAVKNTKIARPSVL